MDGPAAAGAASATEDGNTEGVAAGAAAGETALPGGANAEAECTAAMPKASQLGGKIWLCTGCTGAVGPLGATSGAAPATLIAGTTYCADRSTLLTYPFANPRAGSPVL